MKTRPEILQRLTELSAGQSPWVKEATERKMNYLKPILLNFLKYIEDQKLEDESVDSFLFGSDEQFVDQYLKSIRPKPKDQINEFEQL